MKGALTNKRVLVTYGPTWIAIDDMRVISNRSSGTMGKCLIEDLITTGAKITVLEGPVIEPLRNPKVTVKKFAFFDELANSLKTELKKKYDVIIHAAAVSDFQPAKKTRTKISSDTQTTLVLIPTEKLIKTIRRVAPKSILVGFKLESTTCRQQLRRAALESIKINQCDFVVANSLKDGYAGFIYNRNGRLLAQGRSRKKISKQLINHLLARCTCPQTDSCKC
jgi:phosphopantothenoylcysteine decarboxylase/phosphopantothenate--cysteine ligase